MPNKKTVTEVGRVDGRTTVLYTKPNGQHIEEGGLRDCPDVPAADFLDQWATVEADLVAKVGIGGILGDRLTLHSYAASSSSTGRRRFTPKVAIDFGAGSKIVTLPYYLRNCGVYANWFPPYD